ncbi:MAG TPA: alkaline phosphatase family protein [Candidatus Acidoferrum sp.]|jgi:predicted AlkP superfamily pyrophosphatase or phosphodiesterase|nr:alkaline phosphatase family protein [Candidatus Acidoferrum sp.]
MSAYHTSSKIILGQLTLAFFLAAIFLPITSVLGQEKTPPLLVMVSIDGLRPDYITAADAHGAKVPNLRRFLKDGTYAEGVVGVVPTVTYPSHTTLVTGVWPSKHGIFANTTFDPLQKNFQGWYWYADDIRVPTLWDAAAQAGRATATIQWPVTVGARVTWNIPEFWRAGTPDDAKLLRAVSTPGLLAETQPQLGEYRGGIDSAPESDEVRGRYAQWLLEKKRPGLLLLHLGSLDHIQHETGPLSSDSMATLERLDAVIGSLRETAERLAPGRALVAIVSDHGFVKTDAQLNLFPAFRDAELFTVDEKGKISDWKAMPWPTGGSVAIVLKDPNDSATLAQVSELLSKLARDPASGIDRILEAGELHKRGGYPTASFFVGLKPGWRTGSSLDGPVLSKVKPGGTHGGLPDLPELRASFFFVGPGVPAGRSLGIIDMRDVAPTLAHAAGLSLPTADGKNLLP